jgi:23S rRNA U2552 (ribose-2'-O)-methylase RlmE/FtsJ
MSSFINGDFTDQYLVKLYDDLQKEHQRLLNDMKNLNDESMTKETDIQKQITLVTNLMTTTLKLRNHKKKILLKSSGN